MNPIILYNLFHWSEFLLPCELGILFPCPLNMKIDVGFNAYTNWTIESFTKTCRKRTRTTSLVYVLFKFGGVISWENLQEVTGDNHFMVVIKCSLYYVKIQNNESLFLCPSSNSRLRDYDWDYRWMEYPSYARRLKHPHDQSLATYKGHSVLRTLIRCYFSPEYRYFINFWSNNVL